MAIPDFQSFLLPVLNSCVDGQVHTISEGVDYVTSEFNLTAEDLDHRIPSGRVKTVYSRVSWARTFLTKAGLLEAPRRGYRRITPLGQETLKQKPERIDHQFLLQFPGYVEFHELKSPGKEKKPKEPESPETMTPQETLEYGYQKINRSLELDILDRIKKCSPDFFELLVVDLIVKMGYGGSRRDAGEKIGKSGDEGIDGIVKEDKLGLDVIYLQAKRWEANVGRPQVQAFAGALQGKNARKGILITTSTFSKEARDFTSRIGTKIVLVDGEELAQLMIEHNVGVSTTDVYEVKRIDTDYFDEITE